MSRVRPVLHAAGVAITVAVMTMMSAPGAFAAQAPVGLGTAGSFAVLAGSGITNTGPTTITGNVGTFPTPSETGFGSVTLHGANHHGDAVTQGAKNSLVTAYNDAAGRKPATSHAVELGGATLHPGVYASPTFGLTGSLTLDAGGNQDAQFVFQTSSTLITASHSRVILRNGARACNVTWKVGSSATFNTATRFVGDVLAHTSITAQTGAVFVGRLLARDGAVTLDTNTITATTCTRSGGGGSLPPSARPTSTPTSSGHAPGTVVTTTGHSLTPAGVPDVSPPGSAAPSLPFTGLHTDALVGSALTLLAAGTLLIRRAARPGRRIASRYDARHAHN